MRAVAHVIQYSQAAPVKRLYRTEKRQNYLLMAINRRLPHIFVYLQSQLYLGLLPLIHHTLNAQRYIIFLSIFSSVTTGGADLNFSSAFFFFASAYNVIYIQPERKVVCLRYTNYIINSKVVKKNYYQILYTGSTLVDASLHHQTF